MQKPSVFYPSLCIKNKGKFIIIIIIIIAVIILWIWALVVFVMLSQHLNKQILNWIIAAVLCVVFCSDVQFSDCVCIICVLVQMLWLVVRL